VSARDAALRVAVLSCLLDAVKAEHSRARKAAEEVFGPIRKDGTSQQRVLLPDGADIGLISIKAGAQSVQLDEAGKLLEWCKTNAPQHVEQYVTEGAFEMADVIALIAERFPNLVRERVRASGRAVLDKQMTETGGYLVNEDGEKTKLATISNDDPTGAFSYRPAKGAQDRIMAGWAAGDLREIALGSLALPVPEAAPAPQEQQQEEAGGEAGAGDAPDLGMDEHGFLSPVWAAIHASVIQGGFSTPPIEAYRMIRDGGVGAERALAWLAEHGLDPDDPDEGKSTPWPLPEVAGE